MFWKFDFFQLFCPPIIEFHYYFSCTVLARLSLNERMTPIQIIYSTVPLKSNFTEKLGLQRIILNIFQLTTTKPVSSYEGRFVKIGVGFPRALQSKTKSVTPQVFCISNIGNSLSDCSKSMKEICVVQDFRPNVLNRIILC